MVDTLRALVERLIPADNYPSAWKAGMGEFIRSMPAVNLGPGAGLIATGLEMLDQEALHRHRARFADLDPGRQDALIADLVQNRTAVDWGDVGPSDCITLLIRLTVQGFYGNPENGGNRGAVSWDMVGYSILRPGQRWPDIDRTPPRLMEWNAVGDEYDVVVAGAGAGGGVAACVLAEAGARVLVVERGPWIEPPRGSGDHLRNQAAFLGYETPAGPQAEGNPRVFVSSSGDLVVPPTDPRWHNNAMTVGGGTRVYGAQAWRFCPEDFQMASTYGVPDGSSLADWPITYDDLEPFYSRAEWEIGVSGDPTGNSAEGRRSRPYPMPPLPANRSAQVLGQGSRVLGFRTGPVPLLINSVPYGGRGACLQCGECIGFGCPGDFKNGTQNTVIARALRTGNCDLLAGAQVERLVTRTDGVVDGVALVIAGQGPVERRVVRTRHVVLAAGAVETARLLLNSASSQEPNGIGNNQDQVGRTMQGHVYAGAIGIFDDHIQDCVGPGPSIATNDFRHYNPGLIGGGMIANDFVPTPITAWGLLTAVGAIPSWGAESKRGMRDLYSRSVQVIGPVQEMPNPASRVTVDPGVRDRSGIPVARLSGALHPEDHRVAEFLSDRASEWLHAAGARRVFRFRRPLPEGPSGSQHQAGTCRMGTDPRSSVTDPWGRVWGHNNIVVADGSLHVTNGGVNPVLTILANAYRVSEHLADALSQNMG